VIRKLGVKKDDFLVQALDDMIAQDSQMGMEAALLFNDE